MRAPIIGAFFAEDRKRFIEFVRASTRMTHTDPRSEIGALAVATAAAAAVRGPIAPNALLDQLHEIDGGDDWRSLIARIRDALATQATVADFVAGLGLARGVTGFIYHSVPVALFAWLLHLGDFRATIEAVVRCGGDTDTVASIAGALAGAVVGPEGIPSEWVAGIWDYPCSVANLRRLARALGGESIRIPWPWIALPPRNAVFLATVLVHAFRRLLPPY
jgi:ADP-ribosylglycohydrolase